MKYKAVLESKIDDTKVLVESLLRGLDTNTISKDEIRIKLITVLTNIETVGNTIALEQNDF